MKKPRFTKALKFGLLLTGIIAALFLITRQKPENQSSLPLPDGVFINRSTKDDLVEVFGEPKAHNQEVYVYENGDHSHRYSATFKDNKIVILRDLFPAKTQTVLELTSKLGPTHIYLYNELAPSGYKLYAYPEQGNAFLGKENTGEVLEIWHFSPTSYNTFKGVFANTFSETQTEHAE